MTAARPLALYAVQWPPTTFTDDVLGHLGGTPHGVVMAVAIVRHEEAARLAELEAAYRTVRVQAAP